MPPIIKKNSSEIRRENAKKFAENIRLAEAAKKAEANMRARAIRQAEAARQEEVFRLAAAARRAQQHRASILQENNSSQENNSLQEASILRRHQSRPRENDIQHLSYTLNEMATITQGKKKKLLDLVKTMDPIKKELLTKLFLSNFISIIADVKNRLNRV